MWQPRLQPFVDHGSPAAELLIAAEAVGLRFSNFPFVEQRYVLHLGRGTLRAIAERRDTDSQQYDWAITHHDYHFSGHADGARLWAAFAELLASEATSLEPEALVDACRKPEILTLE